jgi:hypothetical protein
MAAPKRDQLHAFGSEVDDLPQTSGIFPGNLNSF